MIFVTVGTTQFEELVKEMDHLANNIKEKIIIQIGNGKYKPKNTSFFRFSNKIEMYYKTADIVITHGGAGTLFNLLKLDKKIIAIENKNSIEEHQKELLEELSNQNLILWCKRINNIENELERIKKKKFNKYTKPECKIGEIILKVI